MTFQFKIQLRKVSNPTVWRRISVPSTISFHMFGLMIEDAMGWPGGNGFAFSPFGYGSQPWLVGHDDMDYDDFYDDIEWNADEKTYAYDVKITKYFKKVGDNFVFTYDLMDGWDHFITLEEIDKLNISPSAKLLDGKGACPMDFCGGPEKYADIKAILKDENHPAYEGLLSWIFQDIYMQADDIDDMPEKMKEFLTDPTFFDLKTVKKTFDEDYINIHKISTNKKDF